ncbi:ABC transporter ATP-binding protein [Variovorax sp. J31P179]|uniref:ABC transporter ATP-binding protein n=1 Tax=Variovorax sp. J31P179 TaxID=3053508 RepID=UPI002574A9FD|nr:ABC transporter ATP-binding protein [Variovorax sp. J31P179]MDM0084708.1 ABC transporter ATP-binding protein [Variovorax sp. J31P179]
MKQALGAHPAALAPDRAQSLTRQRAEHGIQIDNVTIAFGGAPPVMSGVNLNVRTGEFLAIVGASGCGKTTLMNAVAGLVPVRDGRVLVNGHEPVAGQGDVAYTLARDALLPWRTARQNVEYALMLSGVGNPARTDTARRFLDNVGLLKHENHFPSQLSHGQRQRVALARAFAVDRDIYLLDEPFSALDVQTKVVLHDQLLALWEATRKTVVFVTHDIGEAVTLADRVVVMGTRGRGIIETIDVDIPRPRSAAELQESDAFHQVYKRAWHALRQGMS